MEIELGPFPQLVLGALVRLNVPYAVTGSVVSAHYGKPRATVDTDILIDPTREQLQALIKELEAVAMADWQMAEEAFNRRSMFNVISYETIEKVDLILLRKDEYEQTAFGRRKRDSIKGFPLYMLTVEDAILSKLVWSRRSESERQLEDVVSTMTVQWRQLDWQYLQHWVEHLKLEKSLQRARAQAEIRLKF